MSTTTETEVQCPGLSSEDQKGRRQHISGYRSTHQRAAWEFSTTLISTLVMLFFHDSVPSGLKWAWIVLYGLHVVRWFMIFHGTTMTDWELVWN